MEGRRRVCSECPPQAGSRRIKVPGVLERLLAAILNCYFVWNEVGSLEIRSWLLLQSQLGGIEGVSIATTQRHAPPMNKRTVCLLFDILAPEIGFRKSKENNFSPFGLIALSTSSKHKVGQRD